MPKSREPPKPERIKPRQSTPEERDEPVKVPLAFGDLLEGLLAVDPEETTDPETVKLEKARQETNESRRRH